MTDGMRTLLEGEQGRCTTVSVLPVHGAGSGQIHAVCDDPSANNRQTEQSTRMDNEACPRADGHEWHLRIQRASWEAAAWGDAKDKMVEEDQTPLSTTSTMSEPSSPRPSTPASGRRFDLIAFYQDALAHDEVRTGATFPLGRL
jgi:hypothetical protein